MRLFNNFSSSLALFYNYYDGWDLSILIFSFLLTHPLLSVNEKQNEEVSELMSEIISFLALNGLRIMVGSAILP